MADLVLPPALRIARSRFNYVDPSGTSVSRYSGEAQTTSNGGDRVSCTLDFTPHGGLAAPGPSERAQLKAFLMAMKGRQNRLWATDPSSPLRGAFPATELLLNHDFSGGVTNWTGASVEITPSVADGVYRGTVNRSFSSSVDLIRQTNAANVTQYAPHVMRWLFKQGRYPGNAASRWRNGAGTAIATGTVYSAPDRYIVDSYTPESTTALLGALNASATGNPMAGDYFLIPFASASRCLLADGGGNRLQHSDTPTNAAWSKTRCSASAVGGTAPDGVTDAEAIIEDSSASTSHFFTQSGTRTSAITDLCVYGFFKRRTGTRDIRLVVGNTTLNYSHCIFDLLAGTAGTVSNVGTATNGRAFIADAGSGWFFCCLVSRAEAATTIYNEFAMASAGSISYSGDGSSSIYAWRVGSEVSSVPTRGTATTSAAVAPASQPGSSVLYVKGGRAPGEGALADAVVMGDWLEIDGQIVMAVENMNLGAAGLGYLRVSPPLRRAVPDNTPIILCRPMGRFRYPGEALGWSNEPGFISNASIDLEAAFG